MGYGIKANTINNCSLILEKELALFPNAKVLMLMGDVAIKAVNAIARRSGDGRIIPADSTYKIRDQAYFWRGIRVFPSYLQAGPSFFIEKSKRKVIAEDIAAALAIAHSSVTRSADNRRWTDGGFDFGERRKEWIPLEKGDSAEKD
jgi:uracil-DNA glycosylase